MRERQEVVIPTLTELVLQSSCLGDHEGWIEGSRHRQQSGAILVSWGHPEPNIRMHEL